MALVSINFNHYYQIYLHGAKPWFFFHSAVFFLKFQKILLNLLWWHRLIKLYRFEVDNSIVHHLYIVLCVHHPKSSHLSSPFTPPLPSSVPSFPLPSGNHHTVFCVYQYYFVLNFFTFSPCSPTPLPSNSCQSVLCIYESVSTFFVSLFCPLDSTYK